MELKTPEGKVYYQNSILKITQWSRPVPAEEDPGTTKPDNATGTQPQTAIGGAAGEWKWRRECM